MSRTFYGVKAMHSWVNGGNYTTSGYKAEIYRFSSRKARDEWASIKGSEADPKEVFRHAADARFCVRDIGEHKAVYLCDTWG